ncbi:MAG: arginine--tRNA ligase [Actinomycetota bacterium]
MNVSGVVVERINAVVARLYPDAMDGLDSAARPSDRADAQINIALGLANKLGKKPRDVAQHIIEQLDVRDVCTKVEVAGPGFLNLTFADSHLTAALGAVSRDQSLGVQQAASPQHVVIDYSAPNVAKEMHVGHLRSTVIGDALVRMCERVGHRVDRENHIGDWGTPFGMLIEHLVDLGEVGAARELSVGDLDGFYKQAREKFDGSESFQQRARARVVALQGGDADTLRLWGLLVAESARYFATVYEKLGVKLTNDDLRGESAYNPLLVEVVERLKALSLLTVDDGAEVVFVDGFTNRDNEPLPLIIRKKDGGYNYATSDLACVIDRVERIGATLMLYVVGAPQAQHLSMIEAVATKAGWLNPPARKAPPAHGASPARMVHVAFGSVLGSDRKMLKSRAGEAVKLIELLDEAVERADASIAEKNPELSVDERRKVARMIGIGAVKYADLANDRIKDYVFDWERMLSFDGNTAPYLQYAHARICSIFRRAGVSRESVRAVQITLAHANERSLALWLLNYDSAVWDALERYSPHRLCTYLYELATRYTAFYEHCPVLKADSDAIRDSRLALCDLTARVLSDGLMMLGIESPEQM